MHAEIYKYLTRTCSLPLVCEKNIIVTPYPNAVLVSIYTLMVCRLCLKKTYLYYSSAYIAGLDPILNVNNLSTIIHYYSCAGSEDYYDKNDSNNNIV